MTNVIDPPTAAPAQHAAPESFRDTLRRLGSAQKHAIGAPAYSRWVNRRAGRLLAAGAYRLGLTPNQVSAISAVWSAIAILSLATLRPTPLTGLLITLELLVGYAFDAADGQLARLRRTASKSGEWLDHMIDCAKIVSMHLAVLIGLFRFGDLDHTAYLLVPIAFCVVTVVLFFGMTLNDQLRRVHAASGGAASAPQSSPSRLRALAMVPTDFGVVCAVFLLWGWSRTFLLGYAVLLGAHIAFLGIALVKWFRDMRALDGTPQQS